MRTYLIFPQAIALAYEKPGTRISSCLFRDFAYFVSEAGELIAESEGEKCQSFEMPDVEINTAWFVVEPEQQS